MSDLISRQAAIDAVEHITSSMSVCVNADECHGMKRMQRQAVIELANLPSEQPEPQWIPCSERLPEAEKERYWVCTDTEYQCECRWTNNRFGMGEFDEWGWSIFDIPQYSHVIAWMPLPEPYMEEEYERT